MMEHVQESLAGRVAILQLLGFSRIEIDGDDKGFKKKSFFQAPADEKFVTERTTEDLFEFIVSGDRPEIWTKKEMDRKLFYSSYIQTYLERDVRNQLGVRDLGLFEKFMRLLAARNGELLNLAALASDVGVAQPTVSQWLTVMERSYQLFILRPYYRGHTKRYVKTSKVYFLDTGLLSYLLNIYDAETAMSHHFCGKLFETWVISEIIKSFWFRGLDANIFFWRTRDGDEIDLLYEGPKVLPAEIKLASSPSIDALSAVKRVKGVDLGRKSIICTTKKNLPLASDTSLISAWSLS
jgi:predicted AAA+ superfamily ATPase